MRVEFVGDVLGRNSYILTDHKRYRITNETFKKYSHCTNAKELVESIEAFAYITIIQRGITNSIYFKEE